MSCRMAAYGKGVSEIQNTQAHSPQHNPNSAVPKPKGPIYWQTWQPVLDYTLWSGINIVYHAVAPTIAWTVTNVYAIFS
jgi:hypothetical protein